MSLNASVEKMREAFGPWLEAVVRPNPVSLASLLEQVTDVQCTPEQFVESARELSTSEAHVLLTATLHRSMAYSMPLLPIEEARALASMFIGAAGKGARFCSTCEAADEVNGVGNWVLMVTRHTFESVLYCVGEQESVLLVAVDED